MPKKFIKDCIVNVLELITDFFELIEDFLRLDNKDFLAKWWKDVDWTFIW